LKRKSSAILLRQFSAYLALEPGPMSDSAAGPFWLVGGGNRHFPVVVREPRPALIENIQESQAVGRWISVFWAWCMGGEVHGVLQLIFARALEAVVPLSVPCLD